jgi:hypothetical protein
MRQYLTVRYGFLNILRNNHLSADISVRKVTGFGAVLPGFDIQQGQTFFPSPTHLNLVGLLCNVYGGYFLEVKLSDWKADHSVSFNVDVL